MSGDFVPVSSSYQLSYDPLDFAIKECHKRGMVVHAWVAVTPMGNDKQVNSMPSWSFPKKHRNEMARYKRGWYLDPAKASSTELICSVVKELLDHYALAGICLLYTSKGNYMLSIALPKELGEEFFTRSKAGDPVFANQATFCLLYTSRCV